MTFGFGDGEATGAEGFQTKSRLPDSSSHQKPAGSFPARPWRVSDSSHVMIHQAMETLADFFFAIPAPVALGAVFLLTCAEASLFFGFVIPGEIAVVLGGVLASRGNVPLTGVIASAISGAILGDFIGFTIGRRYGAPFLQRMFPEKWPRVRAWIDKVGGPAVFLGRATAFLRAIVPTAAGAARMTPGRFLLWNVIGGVAWGTVFALLGYFAGEGYEAALRWAGRGSIGVTVFFLLLLAAYAAKGALVRRWTREVEGDSVERS